MNALLVEPKFPIPAKSRNHANFLPIGLLKIASYLKNEGYNFQLIRHDDYNNLEDKLQDFKPDIIFITSLFTYWAKYVKEAVQYYKNLYPNAKIIVGGIYASLMPEDCKNFTGCDEVHIGTYKKAENLLPDYSLVDVDYQIIHASRGCIRKCNCCGVYIIEPNMEFKKSIKKEIIKKKIIFYDNNLLANPHIENILKELILLKKEKKISHCESQSGFDGRILDKNPDLANMIKKSNFKYPKIAWDGSFKDKTKIKRQIDILTNAGYKSKDISVFMLYNHDIPFEEMEMKRVQCWKWNVQIIDCRYRPLNKNFDNYNPYSKKAQSNKDYYIHPNWNDKLIRTFRSNIRKQNICVRQDIIYYSADIERKRIPKEKAIKYKKMDFEEAKNYVKDAWNPSIVSDMKMIESAK
jgi:hypothetical protein